MSNHPRSPAAATTTVTATLSSDGIVESRAAAVTMTTRTPARILRDDEGFLAS